MRKQFYNINKSKIVNLDEIAAVTKQTDGAYRVYLSGADIGLRITGSEGEKLIQDIEGRLVP